MIETFLNNRFFKNFKKFWNKDSYQRKTKHVDFPIYMVLVPSPYNFLWSYLLVWQKTEIPLN